MGGLVAGLYATGKTPQQLANLVSAQLARLTFMDVAGYRSEWRTDLQFGNTYGVESDLYRPFNATTQWFFALRGDATDTAFQWFDTNPGANGAFPLMQARADYFLPVQSAASVFVVGEGGTSFGSTHIGVPQFFLGGPGGSALTARMNFPETNTMTSDLATCTIWLRCRRSLGEECMRLAPTNSEKCMALPTRVDSPMSSLREF